jgi:uncharacterized protein with von Willebrand factor type A (vWA) domain
MTESSPAADTTAPLSGLERLAPNLVAATADGGRIAENVLQFARLLRAAGFPVGPQQTVLATQAVLATGVASPTVLYWALHAVFVTRPEQHAIFDQAFYLFWKDPQFLDNMLSLMLPSLRNVPPAEDQPLARRLREPLLPASSQPPQAPRDDLEIDATQSFSAEEVLRRKDFEQMSADEQRRAREAIRRMALVLAEIPTRRMWPAAHGRQLDLRRMLRDMASHGPDHLIPAWKTRRWRRPPLVVLCDISGSMDSYARPLLHFVHALTNARDRVSTFLFGTRLTHVTRALRGRDPDVAITKVAGDVQDWSGGTRIGESLATFNRLWARRVLGQNATVLLFTDGLDREGGTGLDEAARRLRASCRRLVWLNPLLRYDGYQPLAAGARALAAHVGEMRACHNLASLEGLATALGERRAAPPAAKVA